MFSYFNNLCKSIINWFFPKPSPLIEVKEEVKPRRKVSAIGGTAPVKTPPQSIARKTKCTKELLSYQNQQPKR